MSKIKLSRARDIDIEACVRNVGGNRFDMILIAAARAREIAQEHKVAETALTKDPIISALLEIQSGKVGEIKLDK